MIHRRKINIEPEHDALEDDFPRPGGRKKKYSQVPAVNLPGCIHPEGMQLDNGLWQFSKLFPELQWRLDTPSDGSSEVWQVAEMPENWCIISYIAELYMNNIHVPYTSQTYIYICIHMSHAFMFVCVNQISSEYRNATMYTKNDSEQEVIFLFEMCYAAPPKPICRNTTHTYFNYSF